MDVVGNKVHSIWTSRGVLNHKNGQKISQGLYGNCKAEDGTKGYRQFMNVPTRSLRGNTICWVTQSMV